MVRNQMWLPTGVLVEDTEIYEQDGEFRAKDHISGEDRPATESERDEYLLLTRQTP